MALQDRPRCWHPDCNEFIEHSWVFEAPCGHDGCPSAVWHGLCLMKWREFRQEAERRFQAWLKEHMDVPPPGDHDAPP